MSNKKSLSRHTIAIIFNEQNNKLFLFKIENLEFREFTYGKNFHLTFSPEKEDQNNPNFETSTILKVFGGVTPVCTDLACELYYEVIVNTYSSFINVVNENFLEFS